MVSAAHEPHDHTNHGAIRVSNALAPDYLWVALGAPHEQAFVEEVTPGLFNIGVIRMSGYIHVTDLAAAHVLALKLLEGHSGGAFNLGTGNGFSVREILAAIAAETGSKVPHVVKPRRSGDPTYLVADPLPRARDIELPSRPFGSGHDHPYRLGMAQEGAPAEDGWAY